MSSSDDEFSSNSFSAPSRVLQAVDVDETTFESLGIEPWLVKCCQEMGIVTPTPVQKACIPQALAGKEVLACSETGSGKTAAFALPILQHLAKDPYGVHSLVLTPTRELAFQIADQFRALGATLPVRLEVVVGGYDQMEQAIKLKRRPHVIVATPGRLAEHIKAGDVLHLKKLKFLVLDEADRVLEPTFSEALGEILSALPDTRTTLLFSATITSSIQRLQELALVDAFEFRADKLSNPVDQLEQKFVLCPQSVKDVHLLHLLKTTEARSIIIFVAKRRTAQQLCIALEHLEQDVTPLHAGLKQIHRMKSLDKFKGRRCRVLLCTDVASRGLDIPTVDLVINYDIPLEPKDYIHRVGRTARAGRGGSAVSLVTQYDVARIQNIEKVIGKKLEAKEIAEKHIAELLKDVGTANRVARLRLSDMDSKAYEEGKKGGGGMPTRKRRRGDDS